MGYAGWEASCEREEVGALSRPGTPLRAQTPPDVREQGVGNKQKERCVCVLMLTKMKGGGGSRHGETGNKPALLAGLLWPKLVPRETVIFIVRSASCPTCEHCHPENVTTFGALPTPFRFRNVSCSSGAAGEQLMPAPHLRRLPGCRES